MIFHETDLPGCFLIEPELIEDERGFFARTFDADEFRLRGLNPCIAQSSISYNRTAGTLRGLHYQIAPYQEAKLVRCVRGRVFDVVVDLRAHTPTFLQWRGIELDEENVLALYVPEGVAHGFMTLVDQTELAYTISVSHHPHAGRGLRWDDPAVGIIWPKVPICVSERDAQWPYSVVATDPN